MKKKIIFCLIFSVVCLLPSLPQNPLQFTSPVTQSHHNVLLPFEKIYLSFDRPDYFSGDDVWFKAYLIDAQLGALSNSSGCLYVELISPDSELLQHRVIFLDNGLGHGDFHLKDSLPSGQYQVRAYTGWMRNFEDLLFFTKEIRIENIAGLNPISTPESSPSDPGIDLQFFPEGGALIENVFSTVGFKAVNTLGKGCGIKGVIISEAGDTAAEFETTHLGMGSFKLKPQVKVRYYASGVADNGFRIKEYLPETMESGYALEVSELDKDNFMVTLKTNMKTLQQNPKEELNIIASSRGLLKFAAKTVISSPVKNFAIPKKYFPVGIVRFTLLDNQFRPHCERLAYADITRQVKIKVSPDKEIYAPREKVILKISVRDSADHAVKAYLSLSAVDRILLKDKEREMSDISSYFLLESDIQGRIEQPAYYFNDSIPGRLYALDLLLLTQGWRDFIWKHITMPPADPLWLPESGLTVSGKLRKLLTNKQIENATISLGIFGEGKPDIYFTRTDSAGRFYFPDLKFFGEKTIVASAVDKNNDLKGWLLIDSIYKDPALIKYNWKEKSESIPDKKPEITIQKEEQYKALKKYKLGDTIMIDEVLITSDRDVMKKDNYFRIYGEPDDIIEVTDKMMHYTDIFNLMKGKVAGVSITGDFPNISINIRGASSIMLSNEPAFLLDGFPSDITTISSLPVSEIDKVEVIKTGAALAMFGMNGSGGVISIFTKHGSGRSLKPVFHSINKKVSGFYEARSFYSPKYDSPKPEYEKPDYRSTIFWAPDVITDTDGNATVSFFNSDNNAVIQVKTEGISESGALITGKGLYEVIK
jgi:hypothetical protein